MPINVIQRLDVHRATLVAKLIVVSFANTVMKDNL